MENRFKFWRELTDSERDEIIEVVGSERLAKSYVDIFLVDVDYIQDLRDVEDNIELDIGYGVTPNQVTGQRCYVTDLTHEVARQLAENCWPEVPERFLDLDEIWEAMSNDGYAEDDIAGVVWRPAE